MKIKIIEANVHEEMDFWEMIHKLNIKEYSILKEPDTYELDLKDMVKMHMLNVDVQGGKSNGPSSKR